MRKLPPGLLWLAVSLFASLGWGFVSGPPDGSTGAPGETTCAAAGCHTSYPVDTAVGTISIGSRQLAPGTIAIDIGIVTDVSVPSAQGWGFEITELDTLEQAAGERLVTDPVNTRKSEPAGGRVYLRQTPAGSQTACLNCQSWRSRWVMTSPEGWFVAMYLSAVADFGDGSPVGDYVFTAVLSSSDCKVWKTGGINASGTLTSADIIFMIRYLFRGGVAPLPCTASGDVNCEGDVAAADVIYLINSLFKDGPPPCDVCSLVPDPWWCP